MAQDAMLLHGTACINRQMKIVRRVNLRIVFMQQTLCFHRQGKKQHPAAFAFLKQFF